MAAWCCLITIAAILSDHRLSAGWAWDFLNSIGFVALAGMVYLAFQGRIKSQRRVHQLLSYCVLILLSGHVFGLLILDNITVDYLLPGTPWYMSIGIAAYLLFVVTLMFALPKLRFSGFNDATDFRQWHRWLGWLLIALSVLHIVGSGYYIRHWYQYLLLGGLLLPLAFAGSIHRNTSGEKSNLVFVVGVLLLTAVAITVALNFSSLELEPLERASLDKASQGATAP